MAKSFIILFGGAWFGLYLYNLYKNNKNYDISNYLSQIMKMIPLNSVKPYIVKEQFKNKQEKQRSIFSFERWPQLFNRS